MAKVSLRVALPRGTDLRGQGDVKWDMGIGDNLVPLAKDIADGLRAKGYKCKVSINKEVDEEY
jgi:hypothetical protein